MLSSGFAPSTPFFFFNLALFPWLVEITSNFCSELFVSFFDFFLTTCSLSFFPFDTCVIFRFLLEVSIFESDSESLDDCLLKSLLFCSPDPETSTSSLSSGSETSSEFSSAERFVVLFELVNRFFDNCSFFFGLLDLKLKTISSSLSASLSLSISSLSSWTSSSNISTSF